MTVSEMIASQAMIRHTPQSLKIGTGFQSEDPLVVQISGADPEIMAEAARMNADRGADIIDINMGCPVKKIAKSHAGAALMRNETLARQIIQKVVKAVNLPVTIKIRLGWDDTELNAVQIARMAESEGIRLVTVHGRTRAQMYRGHANWKAIAEVKNHLTIPVIGNGDIINPETAKQCLDIASVDGLMIGRGAMGQPWIFRQIAHYLKTGTFLPPPTQTEKHQTILSHFHHIMEFHGPVIGNRLARKHLAWFTKGMIGGSLFRDRINRCSDQHQALHHLESFLESQRTL